MNVFLTMLMKGVGKRFSGFGGAYVIAIIGMVIAASYLISGGLLPDIERNPKNPQRVGIDDTSISANRDTLQLVNIQPIPTATPGSSNGTIGFETPTPGTGTPSPSPGTFGPGTPTPRGGTPTPTSTLPPQQACLPKTVISLLLDVSTSMNNGNKISQLNSAMGKLVNNLQDDTVIGAVQFAGLASFPSGNGSSTLLPYTRYGSNKSLVRNTLTNLKIHTTSPNDGTYIRNAFSRSISNINTVKSTYENQGYNFVTILFTDGVPETQFTDNNCVAQANNPYICFSRVQDPRFDLTNSMKNLVDKVYSIGVFSGQRELQLLSAAKQLLRDVASQPSYATDTSDPAVLTDLFEDIFATVCS